MSAAPSKPTPFDNQLLCISCGYCIDATPPTGLCPECGRPVAESLPAARPGSPWQQRRDEFPLVRTYFRTLRHPRLAMGELQVEKRTTPRLLTYSILIAFGLVPATIFATTLGLVVIETIANGEQPPDTPFVRSTLLRTVELGAIFFIMYSPAWLLTLLRTTMVEIVAARFVGRLRRWRITFAVALSVCAHAAVGWVLGSLLLTISALAFYTWFFMTSEPDMHLGIGQPPAMSILISVSLFAGAIVHAFLLMTGLRANKFANPPPARAV